MRAQSLTIGETPLDLRYKRMGYLLNSSKTFWQYLGWYLGNMWAFLLGTIYRQCFGQYLDNILITIGKVFFWCGGNVFCNWKNPPEKNNPGTGWLWTKHVSGETYFMVNDRKKTVILHYDPGEPSSSGTYFTWLAAIADWNMFDISVI